MFSCEICEIFNNTYFLEHLQTAASNGSESDDSENDDENYNESIEVVVNRCFSKLTPAQLFSYEICELFKNIFFSRTPLVVVLEIMN